MKGIKMIARSGFSDLERSGTKNANSLVQNQKNRFKISDATKYLSLEVQAETLMMTRCER